MSGESSGSGRFDRLIELFRKASGLPDDARAEFVREIEQEDSELARSLDELLGQGSGPMPTEPSLACFNLNVTS